jgi:hypothetical protein
MNKKVLKRESTVNFLGYFFLVIIDENISWKMILKNGNIILNLLKIKSLEIHQCYIKLNLFLIRSL